MADTPVTVPVANDLLAACNTFTEANLNAGGWCVDEFTVETRAGLTIGRGKGGVLGLMRNDSRVAEDSTVVRYTTRFNLQLYEAVLARDAQALPSDMPAEVIAEVQDMILALGNARYAAKLPARGTPWDGSWAHWLGRVLRDRGHESIGSCQLNWKTFGWLSALTAQIGKET